MHILNFPPKLVRVALLAGLTMAASAVPAASQCKGLGQDNCTATASCAWVDGYTRKDGRTVAGHCRLKGGKKGETQAGNGEMKLSHTQ